MHVVKQVVHQSSGFGRSFFYWFRPEPEPPKIQDLAGTKRPELSSFAKNNVASDRGNVKTTQFFHCLSINYDAF